MAIGNLKEIHLHYITVLILNCGLENKMKPHIKWEKSGQRWLCGGLPGTDWPSRYIDWATGDTPERAYENWARMCK